MSQIGSTGEIGGVCDTLGVGIGGLWKGMADVL